MNPRLSHSLVATAALLTFFGCQDADSQFDPSESALESPVAEASPQLAVSIEEANRLLDVGERLDEARAMLTSAIEDASSSAEERGRARLAMSRVLEAEGNLPAAVEAVERVLADREIDINAELREAARDRLRLLLTGQEDAPEEMPRGEPVPPMARALSKYFPLDENNAAQINILTFGPNTGKSEELGTFNLGSAHREHRQAACPLCDGGVDVHTHRSGLGSWTSIPEVVETIGQYPSLRDSLVLVHFDLAGNRVPSRYDEYLPIPSDDIVEHLESGRGLIVARERNGSPPIVLLAAPRPGQLHMVEAVFAELDKLPLDPKFVDMPSRLSPEEIQPVVRAARGLMRGCYEQLLEKQPRAEGRIAFSFDIVNGATENVAFVEDTMADSTFEQCMRGVVLGLKFGNVSKSTTVTYPLVFSPGDDD